LNERPLASSRNVIQGRRSFERDYFPDAPPPRSRKTPSRPALEILPRQKTHQLDDSVHQRALGGLGFGDLCESSSFSLRNKYSNGLIWQIVPRNICTSKDGPKCGLT
jgi:hypothetical protein